MFIRIPITGVLSIIKVLADGAICAKVFRECRTKTPNAEFQTLGVQSRSVRESGKLIPHSGRHYGPDTSWQRHDHARRPSCDTAIEGSAQRACGTVWAEPQDSRQVAQTGVRTEVDFR